MPAASPAPPPASNFPSALRFASFAYPPPSSESNWLSAALTTLLARLVALLVGVLLGLFGLTVEKAAGHPHTSPDGCSQRGITGHRTDQRSSRCTRSATNQGAFPRL